MAGDLADFFGRRTTVIIGCFTYTAGVVVQTATTVNNPTQALGLIVAGRLIAGFGVGHVSATIIMYMSEICPRKVRGALVSGYQFCFTIGLLRRSLCHPESTRYRPISYSHCPSIGLGCHFGHWSIPPPGIPSLFCEAWQVREGPTITSNSPWST
jgi:SP family sugar:H+ symporter-like MFS transporter